MRRAGQGVAGPVGEPRQAGREAGREAGGRGGRWAGGQACWLHSARGAAGGCEVLLRVSRGCSCSREGNGHRPGFPCSQAWWRVTPAQFRGSQSCVSLPVRPQPHSPAEWPPLLRVRVAQQLRPQVC